MTFDLLEFLKHLWSEYGHAFCHKYSYQFTDELPVHMECLFEQFIRRELDALDMVQALCEYLAELKQTTDVTALIGFLAAKLACYEPESETVKKALEWLGENVHT